MDFVFKDAVLRGKLIAYLHPDCTIITK